jgi:hypothetical protein
MELLRGGGAGHLHHSSAPLRTLCPPSPVLHVIVDAPGSVDGGAGGVRQGGDPVLQSHSLVRTASGIFGKQLEKLEKKGENANA